MGQTTSMIAMGWRRPCTKMFHAIAPAQAKATASESQPTTIHAGDPVWVTAASDKTAEVGTEGAGTPQAAR